MSRSTVAAVLQERPSTSVISDETRRRVMEAAHRMNYRRHFAARSLRSHRTHTIALAMPNLSSMRGTMQIQKLQGLRDRAQELGYMVALCGYAEDSDLRTTFADLVREGRFDGLVIHGSMRDLVDPREIIFTELGVPYVVLEKTTLHSSCVDFDHAWGGAAATRHLLAAGRRRIGFIGQNDRQIPYRLRYEGYRSALEEAGASPDPRLVALWEPVGLAELGQQATRRLLDGDAAFDALVCISDEVAMAAIQMLVKKGLSVPGDVAIVGYDDSPMAAIANPALTSVRQDGIAMGRLAIDMLHRRIETHGALPPEQHILQPELIVRDSSGVSESIHAIFQGDYDECVHH